MAVALTPQYVNTAISKGFYYSGTPKKRVKDLPVYSPRKQKKAEAQYTEYAADLNAPKLNKPPATGRGGSRRFKS